jgi:hypothetical protein
MFSTAIALTNDGAPMKKPGSLSFSQMDAMARAVTGAFGDRQDLLLCPIAPVAVFDADAPSPTGAPASALAHIAFTLPFSMSGHRRAPFRGRSPLTAGRALETLRPPLPSWPT